MDFLTNFERLCKEYGVYPSRALLDAGLSNSLYTKWKKSPNIVPGLDTLIKLAKYFRVSIDTVAGVDTDWIRQDFRNYPQFCRLADNWTSLTPEQRDQIISYANFVIGGKL